MYSFSLIFNCQTLAIGLTVSIITCGNEVGHLMNNSSLDKNMKQVAVEKMSNTNNRDIIREDVIIPF
jgi:hypothetical protein